MARISKILLYLVYVAIVGGLITAIVLSFRNDKVSAPAANHKQVSSTSKSTISPSTNNKTQSTAPSANNPTTPTPTTPISNNSSQSSSSSSASSTSSQPAQNGQLSNTGPGDTIGLFAAVALGGTLVYRRYLEHHLEY